MQNAFKAVSTNSRTLTITLYLTGCKPEQLAPEANPKPGSTAELIKALQASVVTVRKQKSIVYSGRRAVLRISRRCVLLLILPPCYHPATTQATRDPHTGEPYLTLKAGRPAWEKEFKALATVYGREDIGVVFCGASTDR